VQLGFGPWGDTVDELVAAGRAAEDAGFTALWTAELHRSAFVPATALAVATERAAIGTGIALAFARSEFVTALTALDLDDVSDGRFRLGLGTGVRRLVERWHSVDFGSPAAHLSETVSLIRRFVAEMQHGEPITSRGAHHDVDVRGYQRPFPQTRDRIPIYVAALGPVMLRTAGEIADGWLAHELGSPSYLRTEILPKLEQGWKRAGRQRDDLRIVPSACCVPHRDGRQARRWAAGLVAFYASVRTYTDFFAYHGFRDEALAVQRHFRNDDHEAMTDAVPDEMVDAFTLAGTPDEVRARLSDYEGLADELKLTPPTHHVPGEVTRQVQRDILELFA
jgi:probable F420-dependent oxidoreductase